MNLGIKCAIKVAHREIEISHCRGDHISFIIFFDISEVPYGPTTHVPPPYLLAVLLKYFGHIFWHFFWRSFLTYFLAFLQTFLQTCLFPAAFRPCPVSQLVPIHSLNTSLCRSVWLRSPLCRWDVHLGPNKIEVSCQSNKTTNDKGATQEPPARLPVALAQEDNSQKRAFKGRTTKVRLFLFASAFRPVWPCCIVSSLITTSRLAPWTRGESNRG